MTAKEYLNQYREAILRVQAMTDHMAELRSECDLLRTQNGERVRLDAAVANLVEIGERLGKETDRMKHLQQEISETIGRLPDRRHRMLLTLIYIDGKTLRQAREIMHYSYSRMKALHAGALAAVQQIIDNLPQ